MQASGHSRWMLLALSAATAVALGACHSGTSLMTVWKIVDTNQASCYSDVEVMSCPPAGARFYGQDAQHDGQQADYRIVVSDGVELVEDAVTGLSWARALMVDDADTDTPDRFTHDEARGFINSLNRSKYAGYDDWRLPSVKELYSLIDFTGSSSASPPRPYIDETVFEFKWGDLDADGVDEAGERTKEHPWRAIDAQIWTSNIYVGELDAAGSGGSGVKGAFGVNFGDGRIKCYPTETAGEHGIPGEHFVRPVRGDIYGLNRFQTSLDYTITDKAAGLMWQMYDAGPMDWEEALSYAELLGLAGYDDWRLPNAKELQSIVDYTRAPEAGAASNRGPAIDPVFYTTEEESWFWTSTTHLDDKDAKGTFAVYVCFGRGLAKGDGTEIDIHGAGAQRSDPKSSQASNTKWETDGFGPQNDVVRVENYVRCVRDVTPVVFPADPQ